MGYFDGMVASSYKEEDGHFYIIGWGKGRKPLRFLSQVAYETSRKRLETFYVAGLSLIIALAVVGRFLGYGWTILGTFLMLAWLLIFGRPMLIENTEPADIADSRTEAIDRSIQQYGKPTLWIGLAVNALFVAGGIWITVDSPETRLTGIGIAAFFGLGAIICVAMLVRSSDKPQTDSLDRLERLAQLRDKGVLNQEEFEAQKVEALSAAQFPAKGPLGALLAIAAVVALGSAGIAYTLGSTRPAPASDFEDKPDSAVESDIVYDSADPGDNGSDHPGTDSLVTATGEGTGPDEASQPSEATVDWRGKPGHCRLRISGRSYIDGDCFIQLDADGSFQVMAQDESYFAQVLRYDSEAEGYWNEQAGSTHAQARLGPMHRNGACWENATAEICAWDR